ncbi:MAG TPA: hypothetical protein DDY98_04410 [Ruminococcaceae bacterium]|nr:hypothetical protein [Oscillospiraceae bacterium]
MEKSRKLLSILLALSLLLSVVPMMSLTASAELTPVKMTVTLSSGEIKFFPVFWDDTLSPDITFYSSNDGKTFTPIVKTASKGGYQMMDVALAATEGQLYYTNTGNTAITTFAVVSAKWNEVFADCYDGVSAGLTNSFSSTYLKDGITTPYYAPADAIGGWDADASVNSAAINGIDIAVFAAYYDLMFNTFLSSRAADGDNAYARQLMGSSDWSTVSRNSSASAVLLRDFGATVQSYTISKATCTNGSISLSKSSAASGENITVTVTPDSGYELDTLKYNNGTTDTVITKSGDNYTFEMPASNVTVSATFVQTGVHVCQIVGGSAYDSLQAAVAADLEASKVVGYTGSTIQMLANDEVDGNTGIVIAANQIITFGFERKNHF